MRREKEIMQERREEGVGGKRSGSGVMECEEERKEARWKKESRRWTGQRRSK